MAKNCSRSSSTFKFSQQEALPAKGKDTEGLVGLEGSHVVGQKGPQSVLKPPPPPPTPGQQPCRAPTGGDPAGHGGFLEPCAAQLLIQVF